MWNYDDVNFVNIELSSLCNSICAWCPRYEDMSSVVNKQLTPTYITFDQFKDWFPADFCARIDNWTCSGDYGDAGTNPDLLLILDYVLTQNPEASVHLNTNGGMRNSKWWGELGELFSHREQRKMIFSIDGLEDTNHLYRRNVKWDKVMENAGAFIDNGGNAYWDFLIFKHNEHQVADVKYLACEMGFLDVTVKYPRGFEKGNMQVKDADYNVLYELEPIDESYIQNTYPATPPNYKAEDVQYITIKESVETLHAETPGDIECFSHRNGVEIRIAADGTVYPCVHFGHLSKHPRPNQLFPKAQMIDIFKDKRLSLHDRSLKEILADDPYKWVHDSWESKSCVVCWENCGVSKEKKSVMEQIYQNEGKIHGTV